MSSIRSQLYLEGFEEVQIVSRGTETAGNVGRSFPAVAPYNDSHVGLGA